jgi:hypothetical protein
MIGGVKMEEKLEEKIEVRKINKNMSIVIGIIILLGIAVFFMVENGKSSKAKKILIELGYKNIGNVEVYSVTQVENVDTKIQGYKYFVKFKDLEQNKECKGFILKDFKHNIDKDVVCE